MFLLQVKMRPPKAAGLKKKIKRKKLKNLLIFLHFELEPEFHFYLVPDSYSRPQTRESVESAKKGLEYESFEYESRLDTPLIKNSDF